MNKYAIILFVFLSLYWCVKQQADDSINNTDTLTNDLQRLMKRKDVALKRNENGELVEIVLNGPALNDDNIKILKVAPSISSLVCISNPMSKITLDGMNHICDNTNINALSFAFYHYVPDEYVQRLVKMKQLRSLRLGCSDFDNSAYRYIAGLTNLCELRILHSTNFEYKHMIFLMERLERLKNVVINSSVITSNECAEIVLGKSVTNIIVYNASFRLKWNR